MYEVRNQVKEYRYEVWRSQVGAVEAQFVASFCSRWRCEQYCKQINEDASSPPLSPRNLYFAALGPSGDR